MIKNVNREKINPIFAAMKGKHPTWDDEEECRANWRKKYGERIKGYKEGKFLTRFRHRPKAKKKNRGRRNSIKFLEQNEE